MMVFVGHARLVKKQFQGGSVVSLQDDDEADLDDDDRVDSVLDDDDKVVAQVGQKNFLIPVGMLHC